MIGGMALPTTQELGQQYFDAANCLVEAIKHDELEDYRLVNPVLYLYRHWMELALKGLIGSGAHEHDLGQLAANFEAITRKRFGQVVPRWITLRFKEMAAIDPNSTAFRYAEVRDKQLKRYVPVDGEIYVSLNHIQEAMAALNAVFNSLVDGAESAPILVVDDDEYDAW